MNDYIRERNKRRRKKASPYDDALTIAIILSVCVTALLSYFGVIK